ncbi:MAG TPA: LuxR C-terminal-related transcriptional regulator [Actinophytocola sp.]|jgi:DNA-binding CsgD family transcriptional regulator|uniref:LuxR C-terminal-related transcriptional regulator n=1 Tax=Actinophytocola sp. TaxID=1872138 RepID=UPI002DFEA4E0|nr:LuxR C-terminal-related transcriptional regulator [Actinophytocola sp.]
MGRSDEPVVDPAVRALVRQLVALLTATKEPGQVEHLLDVEVNGVRCRCQRVTAPAAGQTALSPREQEIVRMVAKGHTNRAIADVLGISTWTVSTYLRRIFAKLQVNSRAAMVAGVLDAENQSPVARS